MELVEPAAGELHDAIVGSVEPEQQAPQRGLAASRLADEREHLALVHVEVDTVHRLQARAAEQPAPGEVPPQSAGLEQRRHAGAPVTCQQATS